MQCLAVTVVNSSSCCLVLGTIFIVMGEPVAVWVNKHLLKDSATKPLLY